MIQDILGIDTELQIFGFRDSYGFAYRRIEQPKPRTFHRIQPKIAPCARARILENDHAWPAIGKRDLASYSRLTGRKWSRESLERAPCSESATSQAVQVLRSRNLCA